jgi:hypothetical protein
MQLYETAIVIVIASIAYDKEATGEVLEDGGCAADKVEIHQLCCYTASSSDTYGFLHICDP